MKKLPKILTIIGFTTAIATTTAFGQANGIIFTFDEYGIGTSSGGTVLPSSIGPDPSGGVTTSPVLIYNLPIAVLPGDVVLSESGSATNPPSDIVRFWNPTGGPATQMIFYSDFSPSDPPDAPADSGLPSQLINPVFINEVGPEGNNGATYMPVPGQQPGADPGAVLPIQYVIISDVPEPTAISLALMGGSLLLFALNRRTCSALR